MRTDITRQENCKSACQIILVGFEILPRVRVEIEWQVRGFLGFQLQRLLGIAQRRLKFASADMSYVVWGWGHGLIVKRKELHKKSGPRDEQYDFPDKSDALRKRPIIRRGKEYGRRYIPALIIHSPTAQTCKHVCRVLPVPAIVARKVIVRDGAHERVPFGEDRRLLEQLQRAAKLGACQLADRLKS